MASTINTNVMSLNAQRNLSTTQSSMATSMQRLSSGLRVNSAKDDAAGLAIAESLNAQVRGSNVAVRNANDAVSLFQTAEGAMSKVTDSLQRIRELAVQASNDTLVNTDRDKLQLEVDELTREISRIVDNTRFNGNTLLNDKFFNAARTFQVGADKGDTLTIEQAQGSQFKLTGLNAYKDDQTATKTVDITSQAAANTAIEKIDTDLESLATGRATAGALQVRFEAIASQLQTYSENSSAARGRIVDADFAVETANYSRSQILQQAGNAMLAQANQAPQGVSSLLRF